MRVLSWNVAGRADQLAAQLDAALGRAPDVIALQEISSRTYKLWCDALLSEGYCVVSGVELARMPYPPPPYPERIKQLQIRRKNFNVTAARHAMAALDGLRFDDPEHSRLAFPEKFVASAVSFGGRIIEVHNAHAPPGSTRYVLKPQAFEAIRRRIDEQRGLPQILCGDFNTPQSEGEGKPVETWANLYPEVEHWDAAERGILEHPRLRDAYKVVHKPGTRWPHSHRVKRRSGIHERRYDHIYVSDDFTIHRCHYWLDWLDAGLSDHAAVEADLDLQRSP